MRQAVGYGLEVDRGSGAIGDLGIGIGGMAIRSTVTRSHLGHSNDLNSKPGPSGEIRASIMVVVRQFGHGGRAIGIVTPTQQSDPTRQLNADTASVRTVDDLGNSKCG